MRRISVEERRARLGLRHWLAAPAGSPVEVTRGLTGLHGTDPTSTFLAVLARQPSATVAQIERELYERRSLVRLLAMRRTVFVVPRELAGVVHAACSAAVGERSRRTYLKLLEDSGVGDAKWLEKVERAAEEALVSLGEATGAQISAAVPEMRTRVLLAEGKRYETKQSIAPWVMILLASRGRALRARPVGTWASTQWRWTPVPDEMFGDLSVEVARAELARAWLRSFGPATVADLRWWTGWTAAHVKQALAAIDPIEVDMDGVAGVMLDDDDDGYRPVASPEPWVALLPALDPTPMGWQQRDWFLGKHAKPMFDGTGNIGPTVWCDGRVVGGWAQRADGEVVYRLLEDVGSEQRSEVDRLAARLPGWLGDVRVSPRGRRRSELELELLA